MNQNKPIVILGAGISGLATAAFLRKRGENVVVLEQQNRVGGVITSEKTDDFICDFASNSAIEKNFDIKELVEWAGVEEQVLLSSRESSKRQILRNDILHALKGPLSFVFTKLISWRGKYRIAAEPFIKAKKMDASDDETMAEFVTRRFGSELLDYALNPLVAGIYAGKPEHLSMISAYDNMRQMEQQHGSVVAGSFAFMKEKKKDKSPKPSRAILSMKDGMEALPKVVAAKLGDAVKLGAKVSSIKAQNDEYMVTYTHNGEALTMESSKIISTLPAYDASTVFSDLDKTLGEKLNQIYYPAVSVMNVAFRKDQIATPLDSYGFLVPEKENKKYLGAIWSSTIYKNRASDKYALFTLMMGGSRVPDFLDKDQSKWEADAIEEFKSIMKIEGDPVFTKSKCWEKAIPQYNIGHPEIMEVVQKFEASHPGIFISGNFRDGNGVADCIANAKKVANKINN